MLWKTAKRRHLLKTKQCCTGAGADYSSNPEQPLHATARSYIYISFTFTFHLHLHLQKIVTPYVMLKKCQAKIQG